MNDPVTAAILAAAQCPEADAGAVRRLMLDESPVPLGVYPPEVLADRARSAWRYLRQLRDWSADPQAAADFLGWTRGELDALLARHCPTPEPEPEPEPAEPAFTLTGERPRR